VFKQLFK